MTTTVSAAGSIEIGELDLPENISSGSAYTDSVNLSYDGDTSIVADIVTDVKPNNTDSEGLYLDAYPNPLILEPGENEEVFVLLRTHPGLKPDNFNFSVKAESKIEVEKEFVDDGGGDDSGSSITYVSSGSDEQFNKSELETLNSLMDFDEVNQSTLEKIDQEFLKLVTQSESLFKDKQDLKDRNKELNQKIESLNESIEDLQGEKEEVEEKQGIPEWFWLSDSLGVKEGSIQDQFLRVIQTIFPVLNIFNL